MLILILACVISLAGIAPVTAESDEISVIPWENLPEASEDQHTYLLLCVDQWECVPWLLGNTDGIMLVTLDTRAHRVMVTSITRDSMVLWPDGLPGQINEIAMSYTPEDLCRTISEHIGIRVEKFILFDFHQIAAIINNLGGVDVNITAEEAAWLKRYTLGEDAIDRPIAGAGVYHFDGYASVLYMRIRKVGNHLDYFRTKRARYVLSQLVDRCRQITLPEAKRLANVVLENSTITNMNLETMMDAASQAFDLRDCTIEEMCIPADKTAKATIESGQPVQDVDWEANRKLFLDFMEHSVLIEGSG